MTITFSDFRMLYLVHHGGELLASFNTYAQAEAFITMVTGKGGKA